MVCGDWKWRNPFLEPSVTNGYSEICVMDSSFRLGVKAALVPCIPSGSLLTADVGRVVDPVTWELEERISRKHSGFSHGEA